MTPVESTNITHQPNTFKVPTRNDTFLGKYRRYPQIFMQIVMWQNAALDLDPLHKDDTNQHDTSASFMKLFIQQVFNYDSAKMIE